MTAHLSSATAIIDRIAGWRALAVWLLVIFGLSSIPNNFQPSDSQIPADKIAHGIEFAVLGLILAWALRRRAPDRGRGAIAVATVVLSTLYGVTDEFHQRFVPGRDVSLADLAADIVGAMFGAASLWLFPAPRTVDAQRR
jgi:VanZ family protein